MSISPKSHFRIKTKVSPPKKAIPSESSSQSSRHSSFNIWPIKTSLPKVDFLQLYKQRYVKNMPNEPKNTGINLEIIQQVYKLVGEKTFKLSNWREFALEKPPQRSPFHKNHLKLSIFGQVNNNLKNEPKSTPQYKNSIFQAKKGLKLPLLIKARG